MTTQDTYNRIKGLVLAGMSGYAACRRAGEDPLKWSKQLSRDPDIVKAKAAGDIKERGRKRPTWHYAEMPWVVDVLQNGLSQTAAAAKHGKPQPYISLCVKRAKAEQEAPTAAAATSAPQAQAQTQTQTPQPTPQPTTPNNVELDAIANILRDAAKRLNMRPEALAYDMIHRLAD